MAVKGFIDDNNLMSIVNDIENYIAKNYKLSALEYEIVLNMLREFLQKRKLEKQKEAWKSEGNIKDIIKNVFAQVKNGEIE